MVRKAPRPRLQVECLEERTVPAATYTVTTVRDMVAADGKLSLREAITAANNHPGADVIILPAGTFRISIPGPENALADNTVGDFDVTDNTLIRGAGAGTTIVDGGQLDRVFDVLGSSPNAIKVTLQSLTVCNGAAVGDGGGVLVSNGDLAVRDCSIIDNRATGLGGGISNFSLPGTGNVTIVGGVISRNVSDGAGGGVCVLGKAGIGSALTVNSATIRRNFTSGTGGGILTTSVNLTGCTVSANTALAGEGGGIDAGSATLSNCTVSGNSVVGDGGGIHAITVVASNSIISNNNGLFNGGGGISTSTATLTGCTVSGNSAGFGGGISVFSATISNSTICANRADSQGGGIFCTSLTLTNGTVSGNSILFLFSNPASGQGAGIFGSNLTLLNATVTENCGHAGGGVFLRANGSSTIRNSIIAQNQVDATGVGSDAFGDFASVGHNLIGDTTGSTGFGFAGSGDIAGTAAAPLDPKLGPLANNGGRTKTHALLAGSPAIDHGDSTGAPGTDQRGPGFRRVKDGNGDGRAVVDIGAFER